MAAGGFGAVYRARHRELDRPVALKLLHREALADADTVLRFLDEARIAGALRHQQVVRVLDRGVEDGVPWTAHELVEGESLEQRLARVALAWTDAVRMAREVAGALAPAPACHPCWWTGGRDLEDVSAC